MSDNDELEDNHYETFQEELSAPSWKFILLSTNRLRP